MANILLISDELQGLCLKSNLEYIGHTVHQVLLEDKAGGPELLIGNLDLVVIDPGSSPDMLSSLVQDLKKIAGYDDLPILAVVEEMAAIQLDFSIGIQDFIVKPCSLRQMEARLRLALWAVIELTLKEYELLRHLVTHSGRVFTRSDLLDNIWGYDYYGGMRTVDAHIRRLRSKLEDMGNAIVTVRGVGYTFNRS